MHLKNIVLLITIVLFTYITFQTLYFCTFCLTEGVESVLFSFYTSMQLLLKYRVRILQPPL